MKVYQIKVICSGGGCPWTERIEVTIEEVLSPNKVECERLEREVCQHAVDVVCERHRQESHPDWDPRSRAKEVVLQ